MYPLTMKELFFITGNKYKFESAQRSIGSSDFTLTQKELDLPEIQSTKVEEIAAFSAKMAAQNLQVPVVVSDVGYYIEALNGFPGPFIKYINQWLTAEEILLLMSGQKNRKVVIRESIALCFPGLEPVIFTEERNCQIAEKAGRADWAPINEIIIPEGFDRVESEISREEMLSFHQAHTSHWKKLAEYFAGR